MNGKQAQRFERRPSPASGERGVALITVIIVLGTVAVLFAGASTIIQEGVRTSNKMVRFQTTQSVGETGIQNLDVLLKLLSQYGKGNNPTADFGYANGWNAADFAAFLRGELSNRPAGVPDPCNQENPDLSLQPMGSEVTVTVCAERVSAGGLAGSGAGVVHGRVTGGAASNESLVQLTIWSKNQDGEITQWSATGRQVY